MLINTLVVFITGADFHETIDFDKLLLRKTISDKSFLLIVNKRGLKNISKKYEMIVDKNT